MASGRFVPLLVILALSCCLVQSTVYSRCQLTRELLKLQFSRTFLSNWVCLIEQVSDRNTSALLVKTPRRKYYGLFQIGSEWCKEGRKGGKCDLTCESLLDDDIKDDAACAQQVFEMEGFKYWTKWEARCKGHTLPDIENIGTICNHVIYSRFVKENHVKIVTYHTMVFIKVTSQMPRLAAPAKQSISYQRQEDSSRQNLSEIQLCTVL